MRALICALLMALHTAAALAQTTVTDPWVRGTVALQTSTGMYLQLTSAKGGRLVSARSAAARSVEIHQMTMQGDVMRMRALPGGLDLPAGKAVTFEPGGYHFMLVDLKRPLKAGDTVPVTLVIEGSDGKPETLELQAVVRALGAAAPLHKH